MPEHVHPLIKLALLPLTLPLALVLVPAWYVERALRAAAEAVAKFNYTPVGAAGGVADTPEPGE